MKSISITNLMDKLDEVTETEKYCEIRTLINDNIVELYKSIYRPLGSPHKNEYSKKLSKLAKDILEVANGSKG